MSAPHPGWMVISGAAGYVIIYTAERLVARFRAWRRARATALYR